MNIVFHADLSAYVEHRSRVLYWVLQPGSDIGGIGMGLVRMVRPWDEGGCSTAMTASARRSAARSCCARTGR